MPWPSCSTPLRSGAAVSQTVQQALVQVDASMGALQGLRARVGEVMNRADGIEGRIAEQKVTAQTERSNAEDLDMVAAISEFQNRQSGYQAALQAYASVQRLSLFQYLNTCPSSLRSRPRGERQCLGAARRH